MKIIKILLIGIAAIVAIFLVLGLVLPKAYHVERSTNIKASADMVMPQIRSLKAMYEWSPWKDYDPNMKNEYSGTDGEVGSAVKWEGNEDVGKGMQEITSISANRVEVKVHFMEPWEAVNQGTFQVDPDAEGVKVTWGFDGENPFPWNALSIFMDMDAMIGKDFEKGLGRLKEMTEKMSGEMAGKSKTYRGYEIHEMNFEPKVYIAKKAKVKFDEIGKFYSTNLPAIFGAVGQVGLQPAGSPCGIFWKWDEQTKIADMAGAVPVTGDDKSKVKGYETISVQGKALHIAYMGSYEKSGDAHYAMDDYIKEKSLEQGEYVIEEYVTDPTKESDTSKWLTNIFYIVK